MIEATGREHLGQVGGTPIPHSYNDVPRVGLLHPGDGNVMGLYLERYIYDSAGNLLSMQHLGSDPLNPGWTRTYAYNEASLIELGKQTNRLRSTTIGETTETHSTVGNGYDAHGNMLRMPHLQAIQWDFKDQLQMTRRQAVNAGDTDGLQHQGERTFYVYDSFGERVGKVTELGTGQIKDERIYLGGFEIYRRRGANPLVRETLHIMDDKRRIMVETRTQGNDPGPPQLIRYQHCNHLGSASLELDDQAQIISYEEYTPYGSTSYQATRNLTETPKRYRYTAKERDDESGCYYYGARYYAPWLARWTSCDPLGKENQHGYHNPYEYCRNRPTIYIDPDGRDIAVLKTSKISAEALVTKIKADQAIPQLIRDAINVDPKNTSSITFRQGLKGGKMSKSDLAVWNDWLDLYTESEVAARGKDFAFTTGELKILPGDEKKPCMSE